MVPTRLINQMGTSAHTAIVASLSSGAPGQATPSVEPDFVAALVHGAMPHVAATWRPILATVGIRLSLQTVFCHSRSQVDFPPVSVRSTKPTVRCELADVLLVIDDITVAANPTRRAALVQAKMAKGGANLTLSGTDLVQLDLLEYWPKFTFADKGYAVKQRDFTASVTPTVANAGGVYGMIDATAPDWRQSAPAKTMPTTGLELGHYLAGMADTPATAKGRSAVVGGSDDWSFTIDELLSITAGKIFGLASLGGIKPKRGTINFALIVHPDGAETKFFADDDFGTRPPIVGDELGSEPQGISSIRLILEHDRA